jgi:hypothetical protein
MRLAAALTLVLLAGACAAQYPRPDEREELEMAKQQLLRDERELAGPRAEGQPVECRRATQLADNICGLAERICALVARLPPEPARTNDCADARTRCKAARERVRGRCPG